MRRKSEELRTSFDRTFADARVERSEEFVHLLIVRIGTARVALKVADLAGLARAQTVVPIPGTHPGLLGLAGLKGRMVAVYSLATLLGTSTLSNEPERWFVLCRCEDRLALGFIAAEGTLMVPSSELSPVSPGAPRHATDAVGTGPARMWLLNVSSIAESIVKQAAAPAASAEPR